MSQKRIKFKSLAITATDVAAPLSATDLWVEQAVVQNIDAANEVFMGDSTVADTSGFKLLAGAGLALDSNLTPNSNKRQINLKDVYAVCSAAETATLRVGYIVEVEV